MSNELVVAPSPPKRIVWAAYAVPLCVLPSALWRLALVAGLFDEDEVHPIGGSLAEQIYVPSLSVVSMVLALLTLGLVQPWGEALPRWIPLLGGRRVPPMAAVVPAVAGSICIFGLYAYLLLNNIFDWVDQGPVVIGGEQPIPPPSGLAGQLEVICYAPLLAWAPLLMVVTVDYHRRRSCDRRVAPAGV
ncbi:hypothetical protein [Actinomadura rugatobispora]|uniref:Uncharacterized protein n=1 Tax=Actinomadura rugatobispora TaxID=1994 RepID=A0ABW1A3W7_9ACTN